MIFWFFEKNQKMKKSKKSRVPPQESQGLQPGLQPGATQDPGEEGFPRPETPHAGRPRVPDFFIFLILLIFFVFWPFRKKKSKNFYCCFWFFSFFEKNQINEKIKKIQGAPAGRVKGSSQGSSLEHSGSGRGGIPTTRNPPCGETQRPGFFSFFWFYWFFFVFLPFQKKIKKIKKILLIFWVFDFKWKKWKKSRVPPQGESRAPARAPAWSHSGSGRGGIPTARNPPRGETQGPGFFFDFFNFFDFFVFLPFRKKKSKKLRKF